MDYVPYFAAGKVIEGVKARVWDVCFLAIDPVRAEQILFTPPYVVIEGAYLVTEDSPIRDNAEVDQPGVRPALEADARRHPGLRLLPGRFMAIHQAMGTPRGRDATHACLREFIEEMKASGFVAQALARNRVIGASVAPAEK